MLNEMDWENRKKIERLEEEEEVKQYSLESLGRIRVADRILAINYQKLLWPPSYNSCSVAPPAECLSYPVNNSLTKAVSTSLQQQQHQRQLPSGYQNDNYRCNVTSLNCNLPSTTAATTAIATSTTTPTLASISAEVGAVASAVASGTAPAADSAASTSASAAAAISNIETRKLMCAMMMNLSDDDDGE
uniref:Transcription factor kayak n=1 Tax=Syphacia muris TaxID=451379 RepID=A0A158R429_9BILA